MDAPANPEATAVQIDLAPTAADAVQISEQERGAEGPGVWNLSRTMLRIDS